MCPCHQTTEVSIGPEAEDPYDVTLGTDGVGVTFGPNVYKWTSSSTWHHYSLPAERKANNDDNMSLTAVEKTLVKDLYEKISPKFEVMGTNSVDRYSSLSSSFSSSSSSPSIFLIISRFHLHRMIAVYPDSRSLFKDMDGVLPGSPQAKAHGREITNGITIAYKSIDDIVNGLKHVRQVHLTMGVNPNDHRVSSLYKSERSKCSKYNVMMLTI